MRFPLATPILTLALTASTAGAGIFDAFETACFERAYETAHLQSHPAQQVERIQLIRDDTMAPRGPGEPLTLLLRVETRDGTPFEGVGICEKDGASAISCGVEGDGGSFSLTLRDAGRLRMDVLGFGVFLEGQTTLLTLAADSGDDRQFLLYPQQVCN